MGNSLWARGLVIGILLLQIVSTSMIPLSSGLMINNHLLSHDSNLISIQESTSKKRVSSLADSLADSSHGNGKKIGGYTIEVEGWGHGFFLPPRKTYGIVFPAKTRDLFICYFGVITLSGLFNDGYVKVNDETYHQPLFIFFFNPTVVSYDDFYFPSRDYISSIGFSLHRPLILSFS